MLARAGKRARLSHLRGESPPQVRRADLETENDHAMKYTVLGAEGFIGSHVARRLAERQIPHQTLTRDILDHLDQPLGHLLYCIGLTADFRERPFDTVEAHVHVLSQI